MTPATALRFLVSQEAQGGRQRRMMDSIHLTFGVSVAIGRGEKGIPCSELAAKLKVTPQMLAYMESGKRRWPLAIARRAVAILRDTVFIDPWPDRATGAWRRKYVKR